MPGFSFSLYRRSGSPFWWAKLYIAGEAGKSRRFSTGVRVTDGDKRVTRQLAKKRAEEHVASLISGVALQAKDEAALCEVGKRLLMQKAADGRRDRAVASIAHLLDKHVLPFFGAQRDIRTIRRPDLEAFKVHLKDAGRAPVTINNCLTAIRQCLKHAWKIDELMEAIPEVANVRVDTEGKGHALTQDEVLRLLDNIDPRSLEARQFLEFIANTGLRKSECLAMRWGWIDWNSRRLNIPAEFRKGGRRSLHLPLNAGALAILDSRKRNGTKYTGSVKIALPTTNEDRVWLQVKHDQARNSAAKKAGLGRVRTHDLRHTFGTLAWAGGATLPEVRDLLGHRTLAMVNRYGHSYETRLQEAAERVSYSKAKEGK